MTAPSAANDKTTLYGVLGIVGAFCCFPLGIVFAILCLMESKKSNKPPTLAYVAFAVLALGLIANIVFFSVGGLTSLSGK